MILAAFSPLSFGIRPPSRGGFPRWEAVDSVTLVAHALPRSSRLLGSGAVTSAGAPPRRLTRARSRGRMCDDDRDGHGGFGGRPLVLRFSHAVTVAVAEPGTRWGSARSSPDPDPCDHRRRPRAGSRARHSVIPAVAVRADAHSIGCIRERRSA